MKIYPIEEANSDDIIKIAEYFLVSGLSLRSFANLYCHFSITLRDKFLKVLPIYNKDLYEKVKAKLQSKNTRNINEDIEAIQRVITATTLLLEDNLTVSQIAQQLNSTEMTTYRDLTVRLMQMEGVSTDLKKEVLKRLKDHSRANLDKKGR